MPNCSVFCCKKRPGTSSLQKDGVTFHIFPKNPELRKIWKKNCNNHQNWDPKRTSVICSTHFVSSDFKALPNQRRILREKLIPSLVPDCICVSHSLAIEPSDNIAVSKSFATPNMLTSFGESSYQQHHIQPKSTVSIEENASKSTSQTSSKTLSPRNRKMQSQIDYQRKKIKRLQAKNLYLKKKVASLQEILQSLDEKSFINKEEKELIQRQQKKSQSGKLSKAKYSPELRCFALTLHFYSPKAYKYVRKTFGTCLPHPRTYSD